VLPAGAYLPEGAEVDAADKLAAAAQDAVLGDLVVVLVERAEQAAVAQVGLEEIALRRVERLVVVEVEDSS
jgi:hypothetical protein